MTYFDAIRTQLITEANLSPNMLSDIAGLETYISESYNNRSFIELLQNADDAESSQFLIAHCGKFLIIANNGREFNEQDVLSICRSASSNKRRTSSIGYRGIGFKSVVNIATEVHIISGELEMTFSRELTKECIPTAIKVPLVRIPHPIRQSVKLSTEGFISNAKKRGYCSFFIFDGTSASQIEEEYKSIENNSLLFLRNIHLVENLLINSKINIIKNDIENGFTKISLQSANSESRWLLYTKNQCSIAFSITNNGAIGQLDRGNALVYSFLPTEDTTGLGVIVNGDFSTDPSRRHLIIDDITINTIKKICQLYKNLLLDSITNQTKDAIAKLSALSPFMDCQLMQLTGNQFEKIFSSQIKDSIEINTFYLCPKWLNFSDYSLIARNSGISTLSSDINSNTISSFLKYLGAQEMKIEDIVSNLDINNIDISVSGCAQIILEIVRSLSYGGLQCTLNEMNLFFSDNQKCSLDEINLSNQSIDETFLNLLFEQGFTKDDLRFILKKYDLTSLYILYFGESGLYSTKQVATTDKLVLQQEEPCLFNPQADEANDSPELPFDEWYLESQPLGTQEISNVANPKKRWRSAEKHVLSILNNNGFKLEDVSNQNLGYDLEGFDPYGDRVFIEVKSLAFTGQKFRMTNNEYACAQIKRHSYLIALAYLEEDNIEIALIKDPVNSLSLNRQCVQWVWECDRYNYRPKRFSL